MERKLVYVNIPSNNAITVGANLLNSPTQLVMVESGHTIRKGPQTLLSIIAAINPMHWIVFPSPISSANMPFTPFS